MNQVMTLIAGPCVLEDDGLTQEIAQELQSQLKGLPVELYFKASFDKANRSSSESYRGPGLKQGLKVLDQVKEKTGLPLLTDFHLPDQANEVAKVVDFLQIPAFLCRQTDLIEAGVKASINHGCRLNIKKGQFLAPWDVKNIVQKVRAFEGSQSLGPNGLWITERGTSFGYNALTVDMTSFQVIQKEKVPVIYDATHSIQMPGGGPGGTTTGGRREVLEVLARAAMAAGANGLFMEVHPRPNEAKSDGPNAFYLEHVGTFVRQLLEIRKLVSSLPKILPETKNA
ncbi:MAG: 3-deoxy-8-phosphooctulonate synthase [Bdellovibrionaceae bacterium]|nr:3-deoxy-8-phosphooctulonate synthase [Pseudobdellovibrionaceae bacterium]|tara:strand:- start:2333 stop:3184 length:852 start_codon:yes stop_codon:yes gene_type:complete